MATAAVAPPRAASQAPLTSIRGGLEGVAAVSGTDVWAAGFGLQSSGFFRPLVIHHGGTGWRQVASPDPEPDSSLNAIAGGSGRSAWAVGSTGSGASLILHWKGRGWKRVPSPSGRGGAILTGVTAISASDAWTVGFTPSLQPVILHWNGRAWRQASFRHPAGQSILNAVAASSARNAWAVGQTIGSGSATVTVILHWNGRTWKRVPSPSPGAGASLTGVAAVSATSAWAVGGYSTTASPTPATTLILRWNGRSWRRIRSPDPAPRSAFAAVAATSADSAWAVGSDGPGSGPGRRSLIARWNGTTWKQVSSPSPARQSILLGVAAISARNAWAVGEAGNNVLILHWNGRDWR